MSNDTTEHVLVQFITVDGVRYRVDRVWLDDIYRFEYTIYGGGLSMTLQVTPEILSDLSEKDILTHGIRARLK